jgi:hypothetical protein
VFRIEEALRSLSPTSVNCVLLAGRQNIGYKLTDLETDPKDNHSPVSAILSSFTSTCRRHGIDPQHYFTQLLTNLPATPISQLEQWLPDSWKRRNPTSSA